MKTSNLASFTICASAALAISCAAVPPPAVDVVGKPAARVSLLGSWRGDYWSGATGRSGSIRFRLAPETDAAEGQVTMFDATRPGDLDAPADRFDASPAFLSIHLVQVDDRGTVAGVLEPYRDPGCGCLLSTSFVGQIIGDRIEGTFLTNGGPGHLPSTGGWRAHRFAGTSEPPGRTDG